ncbi:hypothetical protein [Hymenobacter cavernae]|uniref:DUF4145 domain-containing protein n=1 Tax=Hymenobacter cavernae TaxID=2044852 RepID=A0ABQ1TZ61_9BACT|nr:hypothetical protein [Hymenobacter cavernae]GGF05207.1 hypothetical protein GCM10011383_15380 [Hymenobacter cavernae]
MDPLINGIEIFRHVLSQYSWTETNDIVEAKSLLDKLINETRGLVIMDFLDAGSWDSIEGIEIKDNCLVMKWHDYRGKIENVIDKEMRSFVFPADLYASVLHFNELRIINTERAPIILLRGYAMKDKEIKKLISNNAQEFNFFDDNTNFSKTAVARTQDAIEVYYCINTPIFSSVIIPKRIGLSSSDSKKILYRVNLIDAGLRLNKVKIALEDEKLTDKDVICEKSNSVRRVFESILKVECCYRYRQINVKKDYSDLMLGDLVKEVKEFREDSIKSLLNQIVVLANELSHDSGKPVTRDKGLSLVALAIVYNQLLTGDINSNLNPHFKNML